MAIVTLAEFKEYQRIEHDEEDYLIERLLAQAQAAAENWCRRTFEETDSAEETENEENMEPVRMAVTMYAGYQYEHRSEPDEKGYKAMYRAFTDLLAPYSDPEKEF